MACQMPRAVLAIAVLVFAVTTSTNADAQGFSPLHDFLGTNFADRCSPTYSGIVAQGRDGNMYGTTSTGGAPKEVNRGTVFQITPAGVLTVIASFPGDESQGWSPFSGLTLGTDGNFYGTTLFYGPPGGIFFGSVFKTTPGGSLTYLYKFTGGTDGRSPTAPPIQGVDGNWYGTTQGDFSNPGTVYKLTPSGTFTTLHQFVHGEQPKDPLVLATDGNFYGTTELGGTSAEGSVFRITPSGTFTVIYQFDKTHGLAPYAPLIQGTDGNFYGTTTGGGSALGGVVFKLTQSGNITVLYNFTQGTSPSVPYAGLVQATDGHFYGTTSQGNSTGGTLSYGTIFRIGANPSTPTYLFDFDLTRGRLPQDTLLLHTNGILYGDTFEGGDPASGCGVFYGWNAGLNPFVSLVFTSGKVGKTVEILGQTFTGTTGVSFNGVAAAFTFVSDTYLTAVVPTGARTGSVTVTTPGGQLTSNKKFRVTPQILSFSPPSGAVGTAVTITGVSLTQATKVTFGGVKATTFTVISDTKVTASVPSGAKTGKIAITTAGGSATSSSNFSVTPTISSFSPPSGTVGTNVTIIGTGLTQTTGVSFGGVAATAFTVSSDTQVTASVPTGALTGKIAITTPGGTATSSGTFTVTP